MFASKNTVFCTPNSQYCRALSFTTQYMVCARFLLLLLSHSIRKKGQKYSLFGVEYRSWLLSTSFIALKIDSYYQCDIFFCVALSENHFMRQINMFLSHESHYHGCWGQYEKHFYCTSFNLRRKQKYRPIITIVMKIKCTTMVWIFRFAIDKRSTNPNNGNCHCTTL